MRETERVVAVVPSLSRRQEAYRILRDRGELLCECPAYAYGRVCKHLRLYEYAVRQMNRCRRDHGVAADTLCAACLVRVLVGAARQVKEATPPKHRLPSGERVTEREAVTFATGDRVSYRTSSGYRLTAVVTGRTVVGKQTPGYVITLDEEQNAQAPRVRRVAWYSLAKEI